MLLATFYLRKPGTPMLRSIIAQSRVEIEDNFATYFDHTAAFKALYH